jgi:hypothetical protein
MDKGCESYVVIYTFFCFKKKRPSQNVRTFRERHPNSGRNSRTSPESDVVLECFSTESWKELKVTTAPTERPASIVIN